MTSSDQRVWTVLREAQLQRFIASRIFSGTALMLLRAAVSWHVYEISQSAFHLGLVGLVQFLPALVFNLVGGAAADAWDRKRLMMAGQMAPALGSLTILGLTLTDNISLPILYAFVLLIGLSAAFENPARSALLPRLVPRERFQDAVAVHSAIQMGAFMAGPALMGFLVAAFGVAAPYAAHVTLILCSVTVLLFVHPRAGDGKRASVGLEAIREGLAFLRGQPVVLGCMVLDMFAVLFGGAVALLPIYATDILQVGPRGYGVLSAALEIGAVTMALLLFTRPQIRNAGKALIVAVVLFGMATVVFGLSRWFPLSLVAYMAAGSADYISAVLRATVIQLETPDHLRGRISAINMIFIGASNQLGAAESGFVAALTNPTFSVVSGGIAAVLVALIVAWRNPALRGFQLQRVSSTA
ncbi:MAG: MFS transporter [Acidobacteriota bacterium]